MNYTYFPLTVCNKTWYTVVIPITFVVTLIWCNDGNSIIIWLFNLIRRYKSSKMICIWASTNTIIKTLSSLTLNYKFIHQNSLHSNNIKGPTESQPTRHKYWSWTPKNVLTPALNIRNKNVAFNFWIRNSNTFWLVCTVISVYQCCQF